MSAHRYDLDELRERIDVAAVLEVLGIEPPTHRRRTPCPLHGGRHPNFSITRDGRRWRCWSQCGGGDVIDLAARLRSCSTGDAIRWLAGLAGLGGADRLAKGDLVRRARAKRRLDTLVCWRARAVGAADARLRELDRAVESAQARLTTSGPDHDAAWDAVATLAHERDRIELLSDTLFEAELVELVDLWRHYGGKL